MHQRKLTAKRSKNIELMTSRSGGRNASKRL